MPCDSSYMEPDHREQQLSVVACLLDELAGAPLNCSHLEGYHPRVYGQGLTTQQGDALVAELCEKLQKTDVTTCSLEMQMWWRDHQEADRKRVQRQLAAATKEAEKLAALAKLTPHERKLLGH